MGNRTQPTEEQRKAWRIRRILALVFVALVAAVVVLAVRSFGGGNAKKTDEAPRIGYAEGVVATESDSLQKAVDDMYEKAKNPGIALEYKNDAVSSDGVNFDCYIANSAANQYDMYIDIYADEALTDEIFLSELLRPGTAFDQIRINKRLSAGEHVVYVAFTQVEEVNGEQALHAQVMVTMNFHVS